MSLSIKLGILSAANIAIAFLLQSYVLIHLGPGTQTDALFAGMTVPQLVLSVIGGSLMHVLVPLFANDGERMREDAWSILSLIAGLFAILTVVLYVLAPWWVPLTVPGFAAEQRELTIGLTRIQLLGMTFTAINGVQWAAYHASQRFLWAELAPLLSSATAFLFVVWALPLFGITAVAWIACLRTVLQSLLLVRGMGRPVRPNFRAPAIAEAWRRIKPLLLGTAYYKTDPVIDRMLLSTAASGSLSLYFMAQQIYAAAGQVLNAAIATPLVPALSRLHGSGNRTEFRRSYRRAIAYAGGATLAGFAVLVFIGPQLIDLLLGHGRVDGDDVNQLWWIMIWLAGTFVGGALGQVSSSSYYATGDTVTPTRLGIYSFTVYIPLKLVMFHYWGVAGLAFATSAFIAANFFLQHRFLKAVHVDSR